MASGLTTQCGLLWPFDTATRCGLVWLGVARGLTTQWGLLWSFDSATQRDSLQLPMIHSRSIAAWFITHDSLTGFNPHGGSSLCMDRLRLPSFLPERKISGRRCRRGKNFEMRSVISKGSNRFRYQCNLTALQLVCWPGELFFFLGEQENNQLHCKNGQKWSLQCVKKIQIQI